MSVLAEKCLGALAVLRKDFPKTFALEVDESLYWDIESVERAFEIKRVMDSMKAQADEMGYTVTTTYDGNVHRWVYGFALRPGHVAPRREPLTDPALPAARVEPTTALPEPAKPRE